MAAIGSLAVNVVANVSKFVRGMKTARMNLDAFKAQAAIAASVAAGVLAKAFVELGRTNERLNQSMTRSLAIMGDLSTTMRKDMVDAAIKLSSQTTFSAHEAADAYFFLASAGLSAKESLEAMPIVGKFAQAGNFDLALATDLVTDAYSALGLATKDTKTNMENLQRVSDVLVKANTLANASVQQFSESLTNKAGAALKVVGKDIEEGAAVLAAFADQGVKGAEAGTALNIVMRDLQTKAIANADAFRKAGVQVFDTKGEMRNMALIVKDLERLLSGLSDQMKKSTLLTLGFTDKSIAFTQALIGTSEKITEYERQLRNAGGTTERVAEKSMTSLQKAMAKLSGAWTRLANSFAVTAGMEAFAAFIDTLAGALESFSFKLDATMRGVEKFINMMPSLSIGGKKGIVDLGFGQRQGMFNQSIFGMMGRTIANAVSGALTQTSTRDRAPILLRVVGIAGA